MKRKQIETHATSGIGRYQFNQNTPINYPRGRKKYLSLRLESGVHSLHCTSVSYRLRPGIHSSSSDKHIVKRKAGGWSKTKMAFATAKLTELPFTSHSPSLHFLFPKTTLSRLKPFSSLRTTEFNHLRNPKSKRPPYPWDHQNGRKSFNSDSNSKSWINKWPSPKPSIESEPRGFDSKGRDGVESRNYDGRGGTTAIERIVLRLRNLGLGSDDEDEEEVEEADAMPATGEEKLGDLLRRDWARPDSMLIEDEDNMVLPWERGEEQRDEEGDGGLKRRAVRAPSLAELTIEDVELRRLRRIGMTIRERINVPKAGITQAVLEKIHDRWRKEELVRLKFHEALAHDMKTAHEIVEVFLSGCVFIYSFFYPNLQ